MEKKPKYIHLKKKGILWNIIKDNPNTTFTLNTAATYNLKKLGARVGTRIIGQGVMVILTESPKNYYRVKIY